MSEKRDTVQVLVRLTPDLHQELKARADEDDRTMAATIRRAIRQYLGSA